MEEGPEPQELMEHVEHSLHEGHEGHEDSHRARETDAEKSAKSKHMRSAITAAVLAVLAAIGSLLSGHAANDAIILQSKASDQWSYYQAKSTKGHLYEVNKTLVEAFLQISQGDKKGERTESDSEKALKKITAQIEAKTKGYEKDKEEVQKEAQDLEKESGHAFGQHQIYSFAVACFQISIVLASLSILVESGALYSCSVAGGVLGLALLVFGYLK
jgi:hypothetical protein